MNKLSISSICHMLLLCGLATVFISCSKDEETPRIDSVWYNMVSRPVEQAPCAYPGQTICVRGEHLDNLRHLIINGTEIDIRNILEYQSENSVTFQLPSDVSTTGDLIRVVTAWGKADYHFVVRPESEQPVISSFSATTLVPGTTLTITGSNLTGAVKVWLPLVFGGQAECAFDESQINSDTQLYVKIPGGVSFASGRCVIMMEKQDATRNITYMEKVYSGITNFIN
ncbi:MAG: IPT/TIG domain-containing protein [Prevotella sp.]|nr:IPT/TIG domain-containing protein [Prevotella sp.]